MTDYMIVFADDITNSTEERKFISRHLDSSIDQVFDEIMHLIASDHNGCSEYHEQ